MAKNRKTVSVRFTRFAGGGVHWYLRMKTTGIELNDVFPLKVLAEVEADRQLETTFRGLKPRFSEDDYSEVQPSYFKHLIGKCEAPGEPSEFMKLFRKAKALGHWSQYV